MPRELRFAWPEMWNDQRHGAGRLVEQLRERVDVRRAVETVTCQPGTPAARAWRSKRLHLVDRHAELDRRFFARARRRGARASARAR